MAFPALTIDQIQGLADTLAAINTLLDAKAFESELEALTVIVNSKANQSDLDALTVIVNSKAAQSALDALTTIVDSKADQSALDALTARVTALETPKAYSTAMRPDPTTMEYEMIYDTDLTIPLWSDGTSWKDGTGTIR